MQARRWLLSVSFALLVLPGALVTAQVVTAQVPESEQLAQLAALSAETSSERTLALNRCLQLKWSPSNFAALERGMNKVLAQDASAGELDASTIWLFLNRNEIRPRELFVYVTKSIGPPDRSDRFEFLCVVERFGTPDRELRQFLETEISTGHFITASKAAAILLKQDPQDTRSMEFLSQQLASQKPDRIWRAADAIRSAQQGNSKIKEQLTALSKHDDVRVRMATAFALLELNDENRQPLTTILPGMSEQDSPIAIGFVYPSNSGVSHRLYAANQLTRWYSQKHGNAEPLLAAMEAVSSGKPETHENRCHAAAIVAMALAKGPGISQAEHQRVRAAFAKLEPLPDSLDEQITATLKALAAAVKE